MNIEEEDLSREIFPLSHYASNRKRLIEEAFSILRGHKLESTIPPSLRGIDYTELKALCLEELEKIDTLRIVDVIEGRVTSGSSKPQYSEKRRATKRKSSEADVEVAIPVSVLKKKVKKSIQKENQDEDRSPKHGKEAKLLKDGKKKKEKKKKKSKKTDLDSSQTETKKSKGAGKSKSKVKAKKSKKSKKTGKERKKSEKEEPTKPPAVPGERTLMELLELEYRAKAIKALLKFQGFGNTKLDEVFDDSEASKDETTTTANNSQAKASSSSSSSGSEKSVQKTVIQSEPSTPAPVLASPPKVAIPSSSNGNNASVDSDSIEHLKQLEESTDSGAEYDDKDLVSSDDSSTEEIITNTLQPPAPTSNSDSKFELSIDVDDDLDYGNPDDIQDDLPMPSVVNVDSDSEYGKVNETDSIRSKSPSNSNLGESSEEEEGEIVYKTSTRRSKFRARKSEDTSPRDFQITVHNHSRYSNGGSDIESEDEFQSEFKNTVTSSPIKSPVKLESVSESEEGELTGNENADDHEGVKPTPLLKSSPNNPSGSKSLVLQDSDSVEDLGSSNTSPTNNVTNPLKNNQPVDTDPPEIPTKNRKITLTLPNVDEDLDYEEADDYENLNIHCPPALEYAEETLPVTEYPDGAEPITEYPDDPGPNNEYPDEEEPTSEYPHEATPITWYERWYSSKKVQKLVNSTKMCGKVRNKMRSEKKNQTKEPVAKAELNKTVAPKVVEPDVPIIGSIEEYEKLFGKKIVSQNLDTTPAPVSTDVQNSPTKSPEAEAEDDEDDDELWGDIMGST